ncbi:MAG: ABC transporter substrate-binding protein [Bacilli bacterium]|nr:ABC transporter substrate-binding protein [Bacilli bacterium]
MNKLLKIFAPAILCLGVPIISACGNSAQPESDTVTVTDMYGKEVTVKKNPKKVACSRSTYDLLVAFGLGDKIDGVDKKVLANPWTKVFYPGSEKHFAYEYENSYELYLSRGVDLVFSPEPRITDDLIAHGISAVTISLYGTPTFDHMTHAFSDMVAAIWPTSEVKAASKAWNDKFDRAVSDIQKELAKQDMKKEKLFYVRGDKDKGIGYTDTKGSFVEYAYRMLGFESMSATLDNGQNNVSAEALCTYNPDVFVMGGIYQNKHVEDIKKTEPYTTLDAVKNNRIYTIPMGLTQMEQLNCLSAEFFYDQANRLHSDLFEYDVKSMIKSSVKGYFGSELSDEQVTYMLAGLSPTGGPLY